MYNFLEDDKRFSVSKLTIHFENVEELFLLGINITLHETIEVRQNEAHKAQLVT